MPRRRDADGFPKLSPSVWERLEERVESFEAAWARGERPDVADYLLSPDPTGGQLLVELVFAEFEFRLRAGEAVRADNYVAAFPELASASISAGLAALEESVTPPGGTPFGSAEDGPLGTSSSERAGDACERFERALLSGERPRIEDFLAGTSEPERSTLFLRLLTTEVSLRRSRSESPRPGEYVSRFPEYADRLGEIDWAADAAVIVRPSDATPRLDRFDLLERLGVGGFGVVWKARDRVLNRIVAVKIPHPHRLNAEGRATLLREARAAARLDHPNVVRIHDACADGDLVYLVYDYVEGTTLHRRLEERTPAPREAAEIGLTLARAVQHAHDRGVIHRDLKPGNVLVGRDDTLHVTDFGLAKRCASVDGVTREGIVTGSLPYMSPEQAAGNSRAADGRTDVYGLGVILYELLTGRRPFDGEEAAVLRQIVSETPAAPRRIRSEIPKSLEAVCLKAIEKEPKHRYATAAELADDLERFLCGERLKVKSSGLAARRRAMRRRASRLALTALLPPVLLLTAWGVFPVFDTPAETVGVVRDDRVSRDEPDPARVGPPDETVETPADPSRSSAAPFDADPAVEMRVVEIRTDPPNAVVWLFPRDPVTGEVQPEARIGGERDFSPATFHLAPGDYRIVADLGAGRFVEIDQRVPLGDEADPMATPGINWYHGEGDSIWIEFDVPPRPALDSFAFVPAGEVLVERTGEPAVRCFVPAFYISRGVLTVAEYLAFERAAYERSRLSPDLAGIPHYLRTAPPSQDDPIPLRYPEAAGILAKAGLRMPSAIEWDRAMSLAETLGIEGSDPGLGEWTVSWETGSAGTPPEPPSPVETILNRAVPSSEPFPLFRPHLVRGSETVASGFLRRATIRAAWSAEPRREADDFARTFRAEAAPAPVERR